MKLVRLIFALIVVLALGGRAHAQLVSSGANNAPALNPPGGAGNYLSINNPTYTGAMAGPTLNLTGTAPSLTFAGVPMGGSCTGVMFINAISATGVPSCGTPAGSGGGPPLPLSVANGGLGAGTAPTVGQILVASSATLFAPVSMSGNATISSTGALTITSLPSGLTIASPTITNPTITGTLTLPAGSVTDANLANAYSGIGACGAGTWVSTLNRNAAPTCTAPPAGTVTSITAGAGLTGGTISTSGTIALATPVSVANGGLGASVTPSAGQFLMTFTATQYQPVNMSGDVQLSGGGTTTVIGIRSVAVPVVASGYLHYTGSAFAWDAPVPAAGSITDAMLGNAYSGVGACAGGSVATTLNRNAAPTCTTIASLGSGLWLPVNNPTATGLLTAPQALLTSTTSSALYVGGSTTTPSGTLTTVGLTADSLSVTAGIHFSGGAWTADATTPTLILQYNGAINFYADNTATAGSSWAPTVRAKIDTTGETILAGQTLGIGVAAPTTAGQIFSASNGSANVLISGATNAAAPNSAVLNVTSTAANVTAGPSAYMLSLTANGNWPTFMQLNNSTSGTRASTTVYLNNDTAGTTNEYGAIQLSSTGWTSGGGMNPHNNFFISTSAAQGMSLNVAGNAPINYWINGAQIGQMLQTGNVGFNIMTGSLFIGGANQFRSGSFNTTITCGTTNPTNNGSGAGQYWTAGNILFFAIAGGWSTSSGGAGTATLSGLPYPAIDTTAGAGYRVEAVVSNGQGTNAGANRLLATIWNGNSFITFNDSNWGPGTTGSFGYLVPSACMSMWPNQGSQYWVSGWYRYQ